MSGRGEKRHAELYDAECQRFVDACPALAVPWYLMASYLYYHEGVSILSDGAYDALGKLLAVRWGVISHPHKALIRHEDLQAGSLFALRRDQYPLQVIGAALRIAAEGVAALDLPIAANGQLALF